MTRASPPSLAPAPVALAVACAVASTLIGTVAACGVEQELSVPAQSSAEPSTLVTPPPGATPPAATPPATPPTSSTADGLPDSLRCVSAALDGTTDVMRVDLWRSADGVFTSSFARGPLFWSHSGQWFGANGEEAPPAQTRTLAVDATGMRLVEETSAGTLTIDLTRAGAVLVGSFVDDQCYSHTAATLACWNDLELFGSPWAGVTGAIEARFDFATSECKSAAGEPARNLLPIEVVRETGFGECTAVTGRLNGDDFNYPDLVGWNLAGADLSNAELFFASLSAATLNGADLRGLDFGYATVSGSFDDATTRPESGECRDVESPWGGATLECVR